MNETPFEAERLLSTDKDGNEALLVAAKATFGLPSGSERTVALTDQDPVLHGHIYVGNPESSSIRYEADVGGPKLATDVALCGHAHAERIGQPYVDVSLRVGQLRKVARVFGDRRWERVMGVPTISKPNAFERIPLLYERAFGGIDASHSRQKYHEFDPRNPVGIGFRSTVSEALIEGAALPNIENPRQLIVRPGDRPEPHGFGFIAEHWHPRARFHGTYDEEWRRRRMPLLPNDFDERFHNATSPGLVVSGFLEGGEPIEVKGATANGYLGFYVPKVEIRGSALVDVRTVPIELKMNTLIVDTDRQKLLIAWRGMINVQGHVENVRWIRLESKGING